MDDVPRHASTTQLEEGLPDVLAAPKDIGRLTAIVVRPASNQRRTLTAVQVTPERGIDGDRWVTDGHHGSENGQPDPRNQVSLMNARFLRQIAGSEDAMSLAGDNLIVDLDLSEENLPAGSRLAVGNQVVIEISELPHTGCTKFERRYGPEAREFMNNPRGQELHLRGRYARVLFGGTIQVGDTVRKPAVS